MSDEQQQALEEIKSRKLMYAQLFNSENGQAVLKDLERTYHYKTPTFVLGDSHSSAYNEGQRSVVLSIHQMMDMSLLREIEDKRKQQEDV